MPSRPAAEQTADPAATCRVSIISSTMACGRRQSYCYQDQPRKETYGHHP
jgi:hypothetical protein